MRGRPFRSLGSLALATSALVSSCSSSLPQLLDLNACMSVDAAHCTLVDDAGVSHGCGPGGMGPGDRDDGGGLPPSMPPDQGADLRNLAFGQPCLFNQQCSSNLCFYFRVKGQVCTQFCSCNAECPAASLGCGGMGVCRAGP